VIAKNRKEAFSKYLAVIEEVFEKLFKSSPDMEKVVS